MYASYFTIQLMIRVANGKIHEKKKSQNFTGKWNSCCANWKTH